MPDDRAELSNARFPIRVAARRAGVSVAALRAWERRYGAVAPARSTGEQRLYSESDVERITLLRHLTNAGHAISAIANVPMSELQRLVEKLEVEGATAAVPPPLDHTERTERQRVMRTCVRAVQAHDTESLYRILQREAIRISTVDFLDQIATPLMRRIGDDWAAGRVTEAQERVASSALRRVLGVLLQNLRIDERDRDSSAKAPHHVLATTLSGERHENGALMAAAIAAVAGCDVSYPGIDLPPAAIAAAARRSHADVVAISIVDGSAPRIAQRGLAELRAALPVRTRLVVGGASAALIDDTLSSLGTRRFESLDAWRRALEHSALRGERL
jgi:DNA-binding transcriptional MerR regulator/methylmalonyl-CoA mutase cobalamin-binding subunit